MFKVISKVKVLKKKVKLQFHGNIVKNNGTHPRVLSQGILMWNIKALALTVQKFLAKLNFQREGQNDRQDKNKMPLIFDLGGILRSNLYSTFLKHIQTKSCLQTDSHNDSNICQNFMGWDIKYSSFGN